ncbi:hypothetical protein BGZ47_000831 [Haplosporangium gracile]|nr:hypothetical protein BGZ47_000831 [Haplosporangium gracile]
MVCLEEWASTLRSLLKHCSVIEKLDLPRIDKRADGINSILASIGDLCLCVSNPSCLHGCFGEHVRTIMEALPQQRLESLVCRYTNDLSSGAGGMSAANLEVFTVTTDCEELSNISLALADAVQGVWICTNIRELRIAVWITANGRDPAYFEDPGKGTWVEEKCQHWDNLGRLHTQIGVLTNLEILDLKVAGELNYVSDISHTEIILPGLLALDDPDKGKIGCLSKLAGLTILRELRGSFIWTNPEAKERIGEDEVD